MDWICKVAQEGPQLIGPHFLLLLSAMDPCHVEMLKVLEVERKPEVLHWPQVPRWHWPQ